MRKINILYSIYLFEVARQLFGAFLDLFLHLMVTMAFITF
jgi:hypothetical protein